MTAKAPLAEPGVAALDINPVHSRAFLQEPFTLDALARKVRDVLDAPPPAAAAS